MTKDRVFFTKKNPDEPGDQGRIVFYQTDQELMDAANLHLADHTGATVQGVDKDGNPVTFVNKGNNNLQRK